jgi:hypothetical protein
VRRKKPAPLDIIPPSGIFVQTPKNEKFFIKGGSRYVVSDIHFSSWAAPLISVTNTALLTVPIAGKIGFRDGTVCKDFGSGKMYLISDSKKRQIRNPDAFDALGGSKACINVSSEYLKIHEEGEPID